MVQIHEFGTPKWSKFVTKFHYKMLTYQNLGFRTPKSDPFGTYFGGFWTPPGPQNTRFWEVYAESDRFWVPNLTGFGRVWTPPDPDLVQI